jgi:hypothetical protein
LCPQLNNLKIDRKKLAETDSSNRPQDVRPGLGSGAVAAVVGRTREARLDGQRLDDQVRQIKKMTKRSFFFSQYLKFFKTG